MRGGWKLIVALLVLAAIVAVLWGGQGTREEKEPGRSGAQPPVVAPDGSTRPARERPGREREERPGSLPK